MEDRKNPQQATNERQTITVGGGTDTNPLTKVGHYGSQEGLGESVLLERPCVIDANKKELLSDLTFARGFAVTPFHSNSWNGKHESFLTYDGRKAVGKEVWQLAQWGCTKDIGTQAELKQEGNVFTYCDGGKTLRVDTDKVGCISLGINGSVEYTRDRDGDVRERTDGAENWPHILIEQMLDTKISRDCKRLIMEIEYEIDKCESLVNREKYPMDPEVNAGQFQWFLRLQNNDTESRSYGQNMWFGFSMFDTRHIGETPDGFQAYDGGKEDSTGLFIYMPSLKDMAKAEGNRVEPLTTSVVGKKVRIKVNVLPEIEKALKIVQSYGEMVGADVKKLKIASTNLGWELPGNNDVNIQITQLNFYEEY
ncbi:MAG: hypothetical protein IJX30_04070 [Clostridia bacterium]|nr:hypothetical protein [Clostridia bacterium]